MDKSACGRRAYARIRTDAITGRYNSSRASTAWQHQNAIWKGDVVDYGKRSCLTCGKEFTASYPSQLCCSPACIQSRKRAYDAARKKSAVKFRGDFEALQARILSIEERLARLEDLKAAPADEVIGDGLASNDSGVGKKKKDALQLTEYCERMRVKATSLPCGKHERCFEPTRCVKVPDNVMAPKRGF